MIAIFISGAIFIAAEKILENNFDKASAIINQRTEYEFSEKISGVNSLAGFINSLDSGHYEWSQLLSDITERAPAGIKISILEVSQDTGSVSMRGFSPNREKLLEYKNNLEKIIFLEQVRLPIQQLSQKENIDFTINIKLDLENFYK
jgi:hypothetical protein